MISNIISLYFANFTRLLHLSVILNVVRIFMVKYQPWLPITNSYAIHLNQTISLTYLRNDNIAYKKFLLHSSMLVTSYINASFLDTILRLTLGILERFLRQQRAI
jgi:hypothetical protein